MLQLYLSAVHHGKSVLPCCHLQRYLLGFRASICSCATSSALSWAQPTSCRGTLTGHQIRYGTRRSLTQETHRNPSSLSARKTKSCALRYLFHLLLVGWPLNVIVQRVARYLRGHGIRKGFWMDPEGRHGSALTSGGEGHQAILEWLREE